MMTLLLLRSSVTKILEGVEVHPANGINLAPRHKDRNPSPDESNEHTSPDRPNGRNYPAHSGNNRCRCEEGEHTSALASVLFNPFEIMLTAHGHHHTV